VITWRLVDEGRYLFTGDAGVEALERAADYGELDHSITSLRVMQSPHHSSRHNIGPDVLDRLVGPKGGSTGTVAFISAAANSETHPSRKVSNAFTRRGVNVYVTNGVTPAFGRAERGAGEVQRRRAGVGSGANVVPVEDVFAQGVVPAGAGRR
jgi:hypothetical protein